MRRLVRGFALAGLLLALARASAQQPVDEEIVVIGKKVRKAQVLYAAARSRLLRCFVQSSSGDKAFDGRICVEAKVCARQGFRSSQPMNQCVNERLLAWERTRQQGAPTAYSRMGAQSGERPDVPLIAAGAWEIRGPGSASRRMCLRSGDANATILRILYERGQEAELGRGECAQWRFDRNGERFAASRRCFQPGFMLEGSLSGTARWDQVLLDVRESSGPSKSELRESRNLWSARRTGNCA